MSDLEVQLTAPPRVVKRYANRKLYDTRESRYVTLPQIAELVRAGEDVQIIDNRTKENLTSVTLAQIIYESEKSAEASSRQGVKTLRSMIQAGGERLMASLRDGPVSRLVPHEMRDLREHPRLMVGTAIDALEDLQRRADERVRATIGGVLASLREAAGEIARLQARIEELEGRLLHRRDKPEAAGAGAVEAPAPQAAPAPCQEPAQEP